jgi:hypothetical protein
MPVDDTYGVFATCDVRKGEHRDFAVTTKADACSMCLALLRHTSVTLECCDTNFCSPNCAKRAEASSHKVVCGNHLDIPSPYPFDIEAHLLTLHLQRCLALIVQCDKTSVYPNSHPLHNPAIRSLVSNYGDRAHGWTYHEHIIYPFEIL